MVAMASQITSLIVVHPTMYSGADRRTHQSVTSICARNSPVTGEFPAQMTSNAENVPLDDVIMDSNEKQICIIHVQIWLAAEVNENENKLIIM